MNDCASPPTPLCLDDYERLAAQHIDPAVFAWLQGGSGDQASLRDNHAAFASIGIYNRVLRDLRQASTRLQLLGQPLAHPILLAPVAQHGLVHPEGELATVRGASAAEAALVVSTQASHTLEAIAAEPGPARWFQLYIQPRRQDTLALVRRAEQAGYAALVLTLDAPVQAPSRAAVRAGFRAPAAANLAAQQPLPQIALDPGSSLIFQGMMSEAPTWHDLDWLLANTCLPVVAKGVSHPDDAAALCESGVAAIAVSNHGGRGLDGVPAPLRLLPAIRDRVGPDVPLLCDGGIRSGNDVFKAIALGANAVMVGRPQLHALAVAGARGVAHMLRLLRDELELCMALAGCSRLDRIGPDALFAEGGASLWPALRP